MKKLLAAAVAAGVMGVAAQATMSYECWAYQNGSPYKMTHVSANNAAEAERLAWDKFKTLGVRADSIRCK